MIGVESGVTPEDRAAAVDILFALGLITGQRILEIQAGDFDDIAAVKVASQIRQAAYAAGRDAERERCLAIVQRCSAEGVLARSIIDTAIRSAAIAAAGGGAG